MHAIWIEIVWVLVGYELRERERERERWFAFALMCEHMDKLLSSSLNLEVTLVTLEDALENA